ncbi:MAG: hypothetical protein ACLUS6_03775 [Dysosmobacter sp.]
MDVIKMDGRRLDEQTAHTAWRCISPCGYPEHCGADMVSLSFSPGLTLETNLFAAISCFLTMWAQASAWRALVGELLRRIRRCLSCFCSAGMLLGRLEIYPMLPLFVPAAWRKR